MNSRKVWTPQQDKTIAQLIKVYGHKNWAQISNELIKKFGSPKRSGKQCRERWHNHLDPNIEKKCWTKAEQELMFELHKQHGNKWTVIAASMPGRTDNAIKNYFYSRIRRSLRRMGKFVGSKNSTQQMKLIKPSTLTKIFAADGQLPHNTFLSQQQQKVIINLRENCETVRNEIIKFTNYKPRRNDKVTQKEKMGFQKIIEKIVSINAVYEKIKVSEKRRRNQELIFQKESGKLILSDDSFEQSQEEGRQSQIQQEISPPPRKQSKNQQKIPQEQMKCEYVENYEQYISQNSKEQAEQHMYLVIPTVIISPEPRQGQINSEYEEIYQKLHRPDIPDFLIELKDDENIHSSQQHNGRFNLNLSSPGYFGPTPVNNPFMSFQSPRNPYFSDQNAKSVHDFRPFQNVGADEFQISVIQLQRQIELNRRQQNDRNTSQIIKPDNKEQQIFTFGIEQLTSKQCVQ